ncbi:MAG: hypothetical protein JWP03_799 [Phycisphaerales bacterium]|nr:hypothetical protein [Phycisphaerales bacterium]
MPHRDEAGSFENEKEMLVKGTARTLLIVILILLVIGLLPTWGYSSGFGYYPSGGLGLVLVVLVILLLLGKL